MQLDSKLNAILLFKISAHVRILCIQMTSNALIVPVLFFPHTSRIDLLFSIQSNRLLWLC